MTRRDPRPVPPEDDVDRIMQVMEAAFAPEFGEAWTRRQVTDSLLSGYCRYGLIGADGSPDVPPGHPVAGFFLARAIIDEEELLLFAIAPQYRRNGLGRALLARFVEEAQGNGMARVFLEMRRDNPAGVLYAAQGFRCVGIRNAYYRTPSGLRLDAISQELLLS